jgi:hypothetical protein
MPPSHTLQPGDPRIPEQQFFNCFSHVPRVAQFQIVCTGGMQMTILNLKFNDNLSF